jgi:hypothetical protein
MTGTRQTTLASCPLETPVHLKPFAELNSRRRCQYVLRAGWCSTTSIDPQRQVYPCERWDMRDVQLTQPMALSEVLQQLDTRSRDWGPNNTCTSHAIGGDV